MVILKKNVDEPKVVNVTELNEKIPYKEKLHNAAITLKIKSLKSYARKNSLFFSLRFYRKTYDIFFFFDYCRLIGELRPFKLFIVVKKRKVIQR